MKKLLTIILGLGLLISTSAFAHKSGFAPFCAIDNVGNAYCYYYTYNACMSAVSSSYYYVACRSN